MIPPPIGYLCLGVEVEAEEIAAKLDCSISSSTTSAQFRDPLLTEFNFLPSDVATIRLFIKS